MGKKKDERDLIEAFDAIGGDPEVLREWDLPLDKIKKVRGVLKIKTSGGYRMLKRLTVSEARLQYIGAVTDHLAANGFLLVPRFIRTKYGDPYVVHETGLYVLTDWFPGKEADLKKPKNVFLAAETLARFHLAGQGFDGSAYGHEPREDFTALWGTSRAKLESYDRHLDESREQTAMDALFREHRGHLEDMIDHAREQLSNAPYDELIEWAREHKTICHGSYSRQNLIVDKDKLAVVDFDHCFSGHPVHDLGAMFTRYMPRYGWDAEVGFSILDVYRGVREISAEEMSVLAAFLSFPDRTVQTVASYFERTKDWEVDRFASRFKKSLALDSAREAFVQELIDRFGLDLTAPDCAPQMAESASYDDLDESSSAEHRDDGWADTTARQQTQAEPVNAKSKSKNKNKPKPNDPVKVEVEQEAPEVKLASHDDIDLEAAQSEADLDPDFDFDDESEPLVRQARPRSGKRPTGTNTGTPPRRRRRNNNGPWTPGN